MNASQRKFLTDKINSAVRDKKQALKDAIPNKPDMNKYLTSAIMSNDFELKNIRQIRDYFTKRVLAAEDNDREKLVERSGGSYRNNYEDSKDFIQVDVDALFVIPEKFATTYNEYVEKKNALEDAIAKLEKEQEALITRITLASDRTLQKMIDEVDDMGAVSLMDTKLREITAAEHKLLPASSNGKLQPIKQIGNGKKNKSNAKNK